MKSSLYFRVLTLCQEKKSFIVIGTFYFNGALNSLFNATGHASVFRISLLFPENQCVKNKMTDYAHQCI
jgi:hypothetical protein